MLNKQLPQVNYFRKFPLKNYLIENSFMAIYYGKNVGLFFTSQPKFFEILNTSYW